MKSEIIIGVLICSLILGCKNQDFKKNEDTTLSLDTTNVSLEKLTLFKQQDYLTLKDSIIYLSNRVIVKGSGNELVFVDKLIVYVTDLNLNIKKIITLEDQSYIFEGRIIDFEIVGNRLIAIDNSYVLKEISLTEDRDIIKIDLNIESLNNTYNGSFLSISMVDNSKIVTSNFITKAQYYSNQIELGKLFDLDGNLKTAFRIKSADADPLWRIFEDWCWVSYYKKRVYFSFLQSRKVFVFNEKGILLNVFELAIDKRYWQEPIIGETQTTDKDGATMTSTYSSYVSICWKSLQIKNGFIYALIYQGKEKGPRIVKYNLDFEIIEERESNNTVPGYMNYNLIIAGNKLYIFFENIVNIYE